MSQKSPILHHATAELVDVIHVTNLRGEGTAENPVRNVDSYFTLDGRLLVEIDPSA